MLDKSKGKGENRSVREPTFRDVVQKSKPSTDILQQIPEFWAFLEPCHLLDRDIAVLVIPDVAGLVHLLNITDEN